jgi:exopolysaccharide production protein ExoY
VVLLAPLMLFVVALARLLLGTPVLLAERRVGFGGKIFLCCKFRTNGLEKTEYDPGAT